MEKQERSVSVTDKILLTIEEASALSGIGINKIRDISNEEDCNFVLFNGTKRMIKRKPFESFLLEQYSI